MKDTILIAWWILVLGWTLIPARGLADWEDSFDQFDPENWTTQPSGLRLAEEPAPEGVTVREGLLRLDEPLRGVRLTSRRKFRYGTLEARVKIRPHGYQYVGFMSRAPWGANSLMCMSLPEASGWRLVSGREGTGGDAGISVTIPEEEWAELRLVWEATQATLYINGELKGEMKEASRIPQTPIPIILDALAHNPMEVDWIRVRGEQTSGGAEAGAPPPPLSEEGEKKVLQSTAWQVTVDPASGLIRAVHHLQPTPLAWTPPDAGGLDLYLRSFPEGMPVRFRRIPRENGSAAVLTEQSFQCPLAPEEGPYRETVGAELELQLEGTQFHLTARLTALRDLDHPVEIGLGLPFRPAVWRRQIFPRLPWLALSPRQQEPIRLPFLADPEDATVPSAAGNWIFYPWGLLEGEDRTIFWGGMDLGKRLVLSPNNHGCVPAITLAPKRWPAGQTLELSLTLQGFAEQDARAAGLPDLLRWYLSHCRSSDPLTADLFPVRDWTPRTLPQGGGVGMPDVRITRANAQADPQFMDRVEQLLLEDSVPNLWLGSWHAANGSYPVSGEWVTGTGLPLSAEAWRAEVARLKQRGLRPCLYVNQFIVPELCEAGGRPDKSWVAYGSDGTLSLFDRYVVGEGRSGADWFTEEVAERLGTRVFTMAYGDYGNDDFRHWYTEQIKAALEFYQPAGISFDYGWTVVGPNSVYSPAQPRTSQAHGRLRVQADIWQWLREKHPDMQVIVNDGPGSPSQLWAHCLLMESSDVMSDLDFLAGQALGSAMSSMDYFADHDRARWTRLMMLDLARGCSFGAPFWILTSPPESEYLPTWKKFLEFSGRTTRLPLCPQALCRPPSALIGTVWSDGREVMAAALDRRSAGEVREITLELRIPETVSPETEWRFSRLNKMNVEIPESDWKVQGKVGDGRGAVSGDGNVLELVGPLGPGEMILVETGKPGEGSPGGYTVSS